ncbi:hypothetical protein [Mycobacterium sp. 1245801.1]|uniref:hypothetical protein n=1 Tax=Mycobacterium sp. 1245801.1 TaxID=1834075 RepID=UPI0007FD2040|nr:hypothetical protein [Mycobacterium sp. 1245801.1]OBJ24470.1 hypothetical protein A5622_11830 [Mycobacterium sp. 1245801.1]
MSRITDHCGPYEAPEHFTRHITVELPEPSDTDDNGQVYFGDYDIRVDNTGGSSGPGDIWTDFGLGSEVLGCFTPTEVRRIAAELLAAAVLAESKLA